jgi:hypothetical protein
MRTNRYASAPRLKLGPLATNLEPALGNDILSTVACFSGMYCRSETFAPRF